MPTRKVRVHLTPPSRWGEVGAWVGAALLMAAPFFIDLAVGKLAAIIGLALLTVPAYRKGIGSIVTCNIVGILGYLWSLLA